MELKNQTLRLLTVKQFSQHHAAFSEAGLRYLIFHSNDRMNSRGECIPGNGFSPAFLRVGRRVLIDEKRFFECLEAVNGRATK